MEDTRKRYKCECAKCQHIFYACKSIFHEWGMLESGCGSCPECETFLRLIFDEKNNKMLSVLWEAPESENKIL